MITPNMPPSPMHIPVRTHLIKPYADPTTYGQPHDTPACRSHRGGASPAARTASSVVATLAMEGRTLGFWLRQS